MPGLDEAVGVAVEGRVERLAGEEVLDVGDQGLALEVGHRARLRCRDGGGVTDDEHVGRDLGLQGALVGGHEVDGIAEARRAPDVLGPAVQGHHDREVEGHLPPVVADQPPAHAVDLSGVELADHLDPPLGEHAPQRLGGDRLGEGAVERGGVGDLDLVPDAALGEVPVGQEAELQRRDRALDRHVDHVDDESAAGEALEREVQGRGALGGVEGEDRLAPAGAGQPLGLLGDQAGTGRHDQQVVVEGGPLGQVHPLGLEVDVVDGRLHEVDAPVELAGRGRTISSGWAMPKGTKSRPGW